MPELVHAPVVVTMEQKLERALAAVLRRMGLVGKVAPSGEELLRVARGYCEYRVTLATDDGRVVEPFSACLSPPNDVIDGSLPF